MENTSAVTEPTPRHREAFGKILVIQTAFIGDAILVEPLVRKTAESFPQAKIDVLVIPAAAELFAHHPHVDRVIAYDKRGRERGVAGFLNLLGRLRARDYDLALVPHRSFRSALLARLSRIPLRIGFDRSAAPVLLTDRVHYVRDRHEILRNLSLLQPLGISAGFFRPELYLQDDEREKAARLVPGAERIIALAPGSVWATKRWPVAAFARLKEKILAEPDSAVVLIGGGEDKPLCREIAAGDNPRVIDLCGKLSLRESCAVLERCSALVTNDSAPTHLGLAANTRVITLFGATVPEFGFYPHGEGNRSVEPPIALDCRPCGIHGGNTCPRKTFDCMRSITPQQVWEQIVQVTGG